MGHSHIPFCHHNYCPLAVPFSSSIIPILRLSVPWSFSFVLSAVSYLHSPASLEITFHLRCFIHYIQAQLCSKFPARVYSVTCLRYKYLFSLTVCLLCFYRFGMWELKPVYTHYLDIQMQLLQWGVKLQNHKLLLVRSILFKFTIYSCQKALWSLVFHVYYDTHIVYTVFLCAFEIYCNVSFD